MKGMQENNGFYTNCSERDLGAKPPNQSTLPNHKTQITTFKHIYELN